MNTNYNKLSFSRAIAVLVTSFVQKEENNSFFLRQIDPRELILQALIFNHLTQNLKLHRPFFWKKLNSDNYFSFYHLVLNLQGTAVDKYGISCSCCTTPRVALKVPHGYFPIEV